MSARRTESPGPSGFAIIDKEAGWTSHDVVARARGLLGTRKVGHSGTLDPPATGVLVLGVGRGTRLLRFITELPKTYVARFRLGIETSTLDAEGEVTAVHDVDPVTVDEVLEIAGRFTGTIQQIPPMVSAVKVGGKRLYELAREGKEIERAPRTVKIFELAIDATDEPADFVMTVNCSSGTYIRTLAADIGSALGGGAHVRNLRRTAVGSFGQDKASPLESISLISLAEGLVGRPSCTVDGEVLSAVRYGKVLAGDVLGVEGSGPWVVLNPDGQLLAVYEPHKGDTVKPAVVVSPAAT
ncbi:MAG: tRNA pseudouridine(55) synthase TruB [Acidimicrobiales bacterium]